MKRAILTAIAVALFLFYCYCLLQWIQSGHDFGDVWQAATSDWFLAVTLFDMSIFSLLVLIWMYRDMTRRDYSEGKKFLLLFVTLITGVVVPLLHLAFRKQKSEQP
jgi:hypothetical protein